MKSPSTLALSLSVLVGSSLLVQAQTGSGVHPGWNAEVVQPSTPFNRMCSLVVEPNGRRHILYYSYATGVVGGIEQYKTWMPGTNPGSVSPELVGASGSNVASLAVGPNGEAFAAFSDPVAEDEYVRTRTSANSWVVAGASLTNGDYWKGSHGGAIAFSPSGNLGMAYFYGPTEDARYAELLPNGTWSVTTIESILRVGKSSQLAFDSAGGAHVVYQNQDLGQLVYAHRDPGGVWATPEIVGPWAPSTAPSGLAVQAPGLVVALRDLQPPGETDTLDRRTGSGWLNVANFPPGYDRGSITLHQGKVHAAMERIDGRIDYVFDNCGTWVVVPLTTSGRLPDIAITPTSEVLIAFTDTSGVPALTLSSRRAGQVGLGQANSANAGLLINGTGHGMHAYSRSLSLGQPLEFGFQGPPGAGYVLFSAPLDLGNTLIPCLGSLDIGTPPGHQDLVVVMNGLQSPLFGIPPSGVATWSTIWPFAYPQTIHFQALILASPCSGSPGSLTAAVSLVGQ